MQIQKPEGLARLVVSELHWVDLKSNVTCLDLIQMTSRTAIGDAGLSDELLKQPAEPERPAISKMHMALALSAIACLAYAAPLSPDSYLRLFQGSESLPSAGGTEDRELFLTMPAVMVPPSWSQMTVCYPFPVSKRALRCSWRLH